MGWVSFERHLLECPGSAFTMCRTGYSGKIILDATVHSFATGRAARCQSKDAPLFYELRVRVEAVLQMGRHQSTAEP